MKVLSLFDGMACGMLAMQKAGIEVDRYVAYEIDKYAIQTSAHNFPAIEHRGDVFKADFTVFRGFDFLIGGSPCTKWSIAQKNHRETEASGQGWEWFSQYVRALHEAKPRFFVYENNKSMSKAIRASIDEAFGFEAICINSALVSAQNRQRLYWIGTRNLDGTYSRVHVVQPEDRGILLRDVLDFTPLREKANCLCGNRGGASLAHDLEKSKYNYCAEPCKVGDVGKGGQGNRIYSVNGKSVAQTAQSGGIGSNTGLYAIPVEFDGENPVKDISCTDGKIYTVYEVKGGLITINGKEHPVNLENGFYILRKLTIRECKRLQTVPEQYEFPVSDTQAYKMLGNGWTVDVIAHIFTGLKDKQ